MAIVFCGATSHAIGVHGWPQLAPPEQRDGFYAACSQLGELVRQSQPDAIIYLTTDHFSNFSYQNLPAFCVGRADSYFGPIEDFADVPRSAVPGDAGLAQEILQLCFDHGFDPAASDFLKLDHGTITPVHFLTPERNVPLVPIFFNVVSRPVPTIGRSYDFGRFLGEQLERHPKRIAVIGTGGLSHEPATGRLQYLNPDFDRRFLAALKQGGKEPLVAFSEQDFETAGAGMHESKTWIAARGFAHDWKKATLIYYEPIPIWNTGMGVIYFERN